MSAWNTDIKAAPHGRYVVKQRREGVDQRVFVHERVILSTKCGKAILSRYVPEEKRWMMLAKGEQPVAWMPWPEPYQVSPSQAAVVTGENLREPMAAASGQIIREGGDAPQEASDGGNLSDTEFTRSLPPVPQAADTPESGFLPLSGGQRRADGGANIIMKHEDIRA